MLKIIADDKIPFLRGVLEPLAEVTYLPGGKITKADLRDADALLIRTRTHCDASLLEGTPVKFIASATIGFDHIDTQFCETHGIFWTNAPGCNSESVAQYITSLLVTWSRKTGRPLSGLTIGVIGVGNVGSKIARNARVLGMNVLLNDPPRERREGAEQFVSLEQLKKESDFITCHVPLYLEGLDTTFHLVDEKFFNTLGKRPFFINSSRGEVCDNAALKKAIREKKISGAALDVWENEPLIDLELLDLLDFATPHIAGYSADGKSNGTAMSILALVRFFGLEKQFDLSTLQKPPAPENPGIDLLTPFYEEEDDIELIWQAIAASYNILEDDHRLREHPEQFEKLRGSYPLRREFDSFEVCAPDFMQGLLQHLRFRIKKEGEACRIKQPI